MKQTQPPPKPATRNATAGARQGPLIGAENAELMLAADEPPAAAPGNSELSPLERQLLDSFQRDFPLSHAPYADIADQLGVDEADVIVCLRSLRERGLISRVGPVLAPRRIGASTLAAMSVPEPVLERVADLVSGFAEVNHNYEREHSINLWFVKIDTSVMYDLLAQSLGAQLGLRFQF